MTRPKVLLTRRWPQAIEQALAARYDLTCSPDDRQLSRDELAAALAEFEYICPAISDQIDAALFDRAASIRVRALCNFGVGINHIDLAACAQRGIVVTNTPDVLTDDTADLAIMLALMSLRRAGEGERLVRAGRWDGWSLTGMLGARLSGKTIGIVGFGRIGQAVAERASRGFGMQVLFTARRPVRGEQVDRLSARQVELAVLLETADVVSLHVPGGRETHNLIDAAGLARMKPGAVLVNTARGDVVDQAALVAALRHGPLAAAGLDVYAAEPEVPAELKALENVVLLPHMGSATVETRTAMGARAMANLDALAAGRDPPDRVA